MYPQKLESEKNNEYFYDGEYFDASRFKYICTYMHNRYKSKMHSHQFYEMNIIMSGEGRHYIDETSLPARVGDVFVIPPETAHGYYSEDTLDIYHILIKSNFMSRYAEELAQIPGYSILFDIEPYIRRSSARNCNLNVGKELSFIRDRLNEIHQAEKKECFVKENSLVFLFICELCERITRSVSEDNDHAEMIRIIEYIKGSIDKKLTLDDIVAGSHMSKATLNRKFKRMLGTSPVQYLLECRITKAKELLSSADYTKTEIAQMCGFYDLAHMNKYIL